ncbi:hypothetical protein [Hyphomicrobium sp. DY-1]|uniref:hypothetical protein n=1 Tax=Hyphomicrobium sp. DY-1 TaxID=3075650 RepID=UPI0039C33941
MMRAWVLAAAVLVFGCPAQAALAPSLALRTRLNGTGHTIVIPAELKDGEDLAGEVPVTIGADDEVAVDRDGLAAVLKNRVTPEVLTQLAAIDVGDAVIPISKLKDVGGVEVAFNPGGLALELRKSAAGAAETVIPMTRRGVAAVNRKPAAVSGYVNVTTVVDGVWETPSGPPVDMDMEFEGAGRINGWVMEGEARLDGPLDAFICPTTAQCSFTHKKGFKRLGTRFVREFDDSGVVMTAGDIGYAGYALQRGNDVLGVGFSHDAARFGGNDRLTSATSVLALDSPADVEVSINGAVIQHLHLNTGTYRLSDLPLLAGANTVTLRVFTASGEARTIVLTALADDRMLQPGKSVWGVNAGVASFVRDSQRAYVVDDLVANGYFRRGLSPFFTGDVHGQADADVLMAGGDLSMLSPAGLFAVGVAGSGAYGEGSFGYALTAAWDYLPPAVPGDWRHSIHIGAQYESGLFRTPGDAVVGRGGVLYATLDPLFLVSGSWTVSAGRAWSLVASGRYLLPNNESVTPGALVDTGARWEAGLALSKPLTPSVEGSLWASYGNEHLVTFLPNLDTRPDITVGMRFSWQPDARTMVQGGADSGLKSTSVFATRRSADDAWTGALSAVDNEGIDTNVSASLTHNGRFEQTTVTQSAGGTGSPFEGTPRYAETSLRSTTAIAYADGHVAVGAPIHDAFAIVTPHKSIADNEVIVGSADHPVAKGSASWPALVTNLPSHVESELALDAINLPEGYSLGEGNMALKPDYRAGYAVEVGSDHAMTVRGVLVDGSGEPLALAMGTAVKVGGASLQVFTNAKGRFAMDGASPGRWHVMAWGPHGKVGYWVEVPEGKTALVNVGTVRPSEEKEEHRGAPGIGWAAITVPAASVDVAAR